MDILLHFPMTTSPVADRHLLAAGLREANIDLNVGNRQWVRKRTSGGLGSDGVTALAEVWLSSKDALFVQTANLVQASGVRTCRNSEDDDSSHENLSDIGVYVHLCQSIVEHAKNQNANDGVEQSGFAMLAER